MAGTENRNRLHRHFTFRVRTRIEGARKVREKS
jgi:hypothetical protein